MRTDRAAAPLSVLQLGGLAGPGAVAGGVWAVARMQCAALLRRGAAVELVGGWLGTPPAAPEQPHERLFRVRRPFPGARLRGLVGLRLVRHVRARSRHVDVVQLHLCRDFITTAAALLLARTAVPVVAQAHGMLAAPASRGLRLFDALVFRHALRTPRLWLTLTDAEERNLESLGIPRGSMRRVVNATVGSGTLWQDPTESTFVFVSRLAPRKQPTVFVAAALALLRDGVDAHFVIAGPDQGELEAVRALIDGSEYRDRFELPGELTADEVAVTLSRSTAVVLPARHEPYPMVVIEAAAVGAPIILTSECGLAAELRNAGAAVIADPNVEAFRAAMATVAADPELRRGLSARARALHSRRWSAETLAGHLEGLYAEVIHAGRH